MEENKINEVDSENEKMRKTLIAFFKEFSETISLEPATIDPKKVIDWLEKLRIS